MPSAYILANVKVTNPEQYEEYKKLSTIAMQAHENLWQLAAMEVL